jgi:hypothetical protein
MEMGDHHADHRAIFYHPWNPHIPMARKVKTNAKKKPGAQPGNKNAEKHGFYSKRFTQDENKRLESSDRASLESEIDLIRVCMDRLYEQLDLDAIYLTNKDGGQSPIRDDHYLKQLNTLALMNQSLATIIRTQYLTHGKGGEIQNTIMQALAELALEMQL